MAPQNMTIEESVTLNTTLIILWSFIGNATENIDLSELYEFVITEFQKADTQRTICIVVLMNFAARILRAILRCLKYLFCCECCDKS